MRKKETQTDSAPEKKSKKKSGCLVVVAAAIIIGVIATAGGNSSSNSESTAAIESTISENVDTIGSNAAEVETTATPETEINVPTEYKSALKKAESYSNMMHMSKAGIYNQLTSEYGEKFSPEAAQYAVDNLNADWNANALAKAEDYSNTMHMSKAGVYDQLISEYGEKFTQEEADYAIANLN